VPPFPVQVSGRAQRVFLGQCDKGIQHRLKLFCGLEISGGEFSHAHLPGAQKLCGLRDSRRHGAISTTRLRPRDEGRRERHHHAAPYHPAQDVTPPQRAWLMAECLSVIVPYHHFSP
jgi:hypothetical protein